MNKNDITSSSFLNKKNVYLLIQISVFISFVIISLGMVFSRGVCCGDDAFHAVVAKNLASGLGYASTLQPLESEYSIKLFDPLLGTGPSTILPAALLIKLVGNTYWAPGVTGVILWAVPLFFIGWYMNIFYKNKAHVTLSVITFFFLSYIFMAYHFEQWYALLGEIPVAMLIILAILIFIDRNSKVNLFFVGLLFSLACQSKIIAIVPFISFILFVILYQIIQNKENNYKEIIKAIIHNVILISLGFLVPLFLIELWKLGSMGIKGYHNYWLLYFDYISEGGVTSDPISITNLSERIILLLRRLGIYLPLIFLLFVGIGISIRKENRLFLIYISLVIITIINTIYWFLFSIGWVRYYIISLIFVICILSLPFLSANIKRSGIIIYGFLLIIIIYYNTQMINITYPFRDMVLFEPTQSTQALEAVSHILSSQIDKKPFVTQWWATAVDVEYLLNTHLNFTTYWDPDISFDKPFLFIANSKFADVSAEQYKKYLDLCDIKNIGQYIYGECGPSLSP